MKYVQTGINLFAIAFMVLVIMAGCRQNSRNTKTVNVKELNEQDVQMMEIAPGSNLVAQAAEPIIIEAYLFLPENSEPVRTKIRIMPGTWIIPEQMITVPGVPPSVGIVPEPRTAPQLDPIEPYVNPEQKFPICTDKFCEVSYG